MELLYLVLNKAPLESTFVNFKTKDYKVISGRTNKTILNQMASLDSSGAILEIDKSQKTFMHRLILNGVHQPDTL